MIYSNLSVNEAGHLTIAGLDAVALTEEYGSPLMVLDEGRVREHCRTYVESMQKYLPAGSMPLYAGKAFCFKGLYKIIESEGMGADVVSPGEVYTVSAAGFPMEHVYFHGNNKTDEDIALAIEKKLGCFVADNRDELCSIDRIARENGITQRVLLRLTPGIDPHTHAKISTGKVDSKFGTAIETGQAMELVEFALSLKNIDLEGFHCHIGSQIFDSSPFCDAADIMLQFIADVKAKFGYAVKVLNLGGGYGVRYVESHPEIDIADNIRQLGEHIDADCKKLGITPPQIRLEPGRSIVADCCTTLYKIGSVKTITGYKSYVSIDGGMTDNPRYALYGSEYTVLNASRANEKADFVCTVAGRCCESGDLIQEDVAIANPKRGDILAVLCTGAYNYSMASNYNRICRPAVVIVKDGKTRLGIRRETFEDLIRNDM
ncbi:MAG: diaminopimelate decarboxylase [Clostridia bacterium]|nr:diaminopimelate decarboxylase [Clostridia bacterium]